MLEQLKANWQTIWHNVLPEPLISVIGILSIVFGAIKAWQNKKILPLVFFGSIGVAIMVIF